MKIIKTSEKKAKLIAAKNETPLSVGEEIYVFKRALNKTTNNPNAQEMCTILSLDGGIVVREGSARDKGYGAITINKEDIAGRDIIEIGANPFDERQSNIRPVAFTLESILFGLSVLGEKDENKYDINGKPILTANWNPFIYSSTGEKQYYQRPFVWTVTDKQNLIESIYQGIDCGKILIRKRGFDELDKMEANGETELYFNDIVDGKQRLNTVKEFILGEFPDLSGNFYSDLSYRSQHKFVNHQLFSYSEMWENTSDTEVLRQFLKLNFAGVPQSREHIEFVKGLLNK